MTTSGDLQTARPRRVEAFDGVVVEIVRETSDTITLLVDAGRGRAYEAGQFVTIDPKQFPALQQQVAYFEHVKGHREQVRAYSLASTPDEPLLAITIKEELFVPEAMSYPPLLSPYLRHGLRRGDRLALRGFSGEYVLPHDENELAPLLVHVVAGSGVVPNFSILKWALAHRPNLRHHFVYSNRSWDEVIFGAQLEELSRLHPDRLRLFHCLTRAQDLPAETSCARLGRINRELLAEAIPDPAGCLVYACGPALTRFDKRAARERGEEPKPRFIETARELLTALEVPKRAIRIEAYG